MLTVLMYKSRCVKGMWESGNPQYGTQDSALSCPRHPLGVSRYHSKVVQHQDTQPVGALASSTPGSASHGAQQLGKLSKAFFLGVGTQVTETDIREHFLRVQLPRGLPGQSHQGFPPQRRFLVSMRGGTISPAFKVGFEPEEGAKKERPYHRLSHPRALVGRARTHAHAHAPPTVWATLTTALFIRAVLTVCLSVTTPGVRNAAADAAPTAELLGLTGDRH